MYMCTFCQCLCRCTLASGFIVGIVSAGTHSSDLIVKIVCAGALASGLIVGIVCAGVHASDLIVDIVCAGVHASDLRRDVGAEWHPDQGSGHDLHPVPLQLLHGGP